MHDLEGAGRALGGPRIGGAATPEPRSSLPPITVDPNRMCGLPCIRDTRVTVTALLCQLAAGQTSSKSCWTTGRNESVTEIVRIPNRGHALTIDSGWREVADTALAFVRRFL